MVREDFTVEMPHLNKHWKEMSESGSTKKSVPSRRPASAKSLSWDHTWHVEGVAGRPMCWHQSKQAKERQRNEVRGGLQFI